MVQKSTKVIWSTLEFKYGGDDVGRKKYVVGKWLQFHMTEKNLLWNKFMNMCKLGGQLFVQNMKMCEVVQASVLLEKFSSSWSNYKMGVSTSVSKVRERVPHSL